MIDFENQIRDTLTASQKKNLEHFLNLDTSEVFNKMKWAIDENYTDSSMKSIAINYKIFLFLNYCISTKNLVPSKHVNVFWKFHAENKEEYEKQMSSIGLKGFDYKKQSTTRFQTQIYILNNKKVIKYAFGVNLIENDILKYDGIYDYSLVERVSERFCDLFPNAKALVEQNMDIIGMVCSIDLSSTLKLYSGKDYATDITDIECNYRIFLLILHFGKKYNNLDYSSIEFTPTKDILLMWKAHAKMDTYSYDFKLLFGKIFNCNILLTFYNSSPKDLKNMVKINRQSLLNHFGDYNSNTLKQIIYLGN